MSVGVRGYECLYSAARRFLHPGPLQEATIPGRAKVLPGTEPRHHDEWSLRMSQRQCYSGAEERAGVPVDCIPDAQCVFPEGAGLDSVGDECIEYDIAEGHVVEQATVQLAAGIGSE